MKRFVGIADGLQKLENLAKSGRTCIVVLKGPKGAGKMSLAKEFGKGRVFLSFCGLAPGRKITAQDQRDAFGKQLSSLFNLPSFAQFLNDRYPPDLFRALKRHSLMFGQKR